jgi:hypothetical protein
MPLDPADFEARGFLRDADNGLFYELDGRGRIRRFGYRSNGEAGEGKGQEVEILDPPIGLVRAIERTWTQGVHPHPDGDPEITLDDWALSARDRVLAAANPVPTCSFCEKTNAEVARMIAGPASYICNECVALCGEIIASDPPQT